MAGRSPVWAASQGGRCWPPLVAFVVKLAFFLWLFVWVRWSLPRFRYDQLMRLGWKGLFPLATLNLVWVGIAMAMRWLQ